MKTASLRQLSLVVFSFASVVALAACGSGTGECSPLLGACSDAGTPTPGNGAVDSGSPTPSSLFTCSQLQNCFIGCSNLVQAQQQPCVSQCYQAASPEAVTKSNQMWSCIQANNCQASACVQQACPTQLTACQNDTGS